MSNSNYKGVTKLKELEDRMKNGGILHLIKKLLEAIEKSCITKKAT